MRLYRAHETDRMAELDGVELADFRQRALAFAIDAVLSFVAMLLALILAGLAWWAIATHGAFGRYNVQVNYESWVEQLVTETMTLVLYWGLFTYFWNGRTPGKRIMRIRVVSLVHERMTLWHSTERALGYAAAALELGFGFLQFFIHPNRRTVQDRIAETIVVKEKSLRERAESSGDLEATEPSEATAEPAA